MKHSLVLYTSTTKLAFVDIDVEELEMTVTVVVVKEVIWARDCVWLEL
jgi:hypothetical protein